LSDLQTGRSSSLEELIKDGTQLVGTGVGTAIGFAIGGPEGAMAGGMVSVGIGRALKNVGSEISKRYLSPREKIRLGAVYIYAAEKININIKNGIELRKDDFFTENLKERSTAEEIVEGVLQAAQKDHEEKKLPYYGNLLANIAFSPEVDRGNANLLVKIAGNLSYYQLCFLSIFGQNSFNLRGDDYRSNLELKYDLLALLHEVYDLANLQLIGSESAMLGIVDIAPGKLKLQGQGQLIFKLMELSKIPSDELAVLAEKLSH
jgi:hypothetical protein